MKSSSIPHRLHPCSFVSLVRASLLTALVLALVVPSRAGDIVVDGNLNVLSNSTVRGTLTVSSNVVFESKILVAPNQSLSESGSLLTLGLGDARYVRGAGLVTGLGGYGLPLAPGAQAVAAGAGSVADGNFSISVGEYSWAGGYASSAFGSSSVAGGYYSGVLGLNLRAQGFCQMVVGKYNIAQGDGFSCVPTDDAFIVGNGSALARSNAFRLTWGGDAWMAGGLAVSSNAVFHSSVVTEGRLGIGTNAPAALLHVNGNARFDGPVQIRRLLPQGDLSMGSYTNAPAAGE